jgi:hypothetical protein
MARLWEHYPTIFLKHRAWGHPVEDLGSFVTTDKYNRRLIEQRFRCECQWWAFAYFTMGLVSTGQRAYDKPPGYSPTPSIAEAREEWFIRFPPQGLDEADDEPAREHARA